MPCGESCPRRGSEAASSPRAFSKELLPVGSRRDGEIERPKAVSEYLIERLVSGGATKICVVVSPGKADILSYYGAEMLGATMAYVVQPSPAGLCDAVFRALPLVAPDEHCLVGLPDTIWFPENALTALDDAGLSFLLFPVDRPELFDAVLTDSEGRGREVQVKREGAGSTWVWGAFKVPGFGAPRAVRALVSPRPVRRVRGHARKRLDRVGRGGARGRRRRGVRGRGTLSGWKQAQKLLDGRR